MATFWQSMWSPLASWFGGRQGDGTQVTGPDYYQEPKVEMTEQTAMQLSAVWACVRLISQTIASLPVQLYRMTPDGRELDSRHWFAQLMAAKPNRFQTRYEFIEYLVANLVLHGNAYCKINRVGQEIVGLRPLAAGQVEVQLIDNKLVYLYTYDGNVEAISEKNIWHIKINADWLVGRSPLQFGRNMLGIAQGAERVVSNIYSNNAKRSGVLTLDKLLTPIQRQQVKANFAGLTTGDDSRLLVLEMGMKFDPISMSPQDIELLASRKFQVDEICRWFGVPSILVNQNEGSTTLGSSTAEIITAFYKLNLRPYLEAIENSIDVHLLGATSGYQVEFILDALLRASQKERYEGYQIGINNGVITPNEARKMEWLPEMAGGDKLYMQGAMSPIDKLGQPNPADEALINAANAE